MRKKAKCSKQNVNRSGAWSSEEDNILMKYIQLHGEGKWRQLSKRAGLKRCGKSCRLRWLNYLKPDIKRGNISLEEEDLIMRLHNLLGNRWSLIAGRLPGRTDNEIKNYWNTHLRKKVEQKLINNSNKLRVESSPAGCSRNMNSLAIMDPPKSQHPMIKPNKSMSSTKVMIPTNDSVNTMNLTTASVGDHSKNTTTTSACTAQKDSPAGFLNEFDMSDMLIPNEDCNFNGFACCVQIPQQFEDLDDSYLISEAWYENWKIDEYFPPEMEAYVDFS